MTKEDEVAIEAVRVARNEAYQILHSAPSPESKAAYLEANRIYQKVRYELDPAYRAMKKKSYEEWRERKKLGIPGPRSKNSS